jgi:xanthine dehydrogenase molybdenum-binding subunit
MHGDELFFWYSNQDGGFNLRNTSIREMPRGKMHIFMPLTGIQSVGGGNAYGHLFCDRIAYLMCKRLKRPVFAPMERTSFHGGEWTNGIYKNKIGFKDDGQITAAEAESLQVRDAFETIMTVHKASSIRPLKEHRMMANTSRGPAICYRDGAEVECEFNEVFGQVAAALDIDPCDVALHPLNDGADGIPFDSDDDRAFRQKHFLYPDRHSRKECIEMGKAALDWDNKWHKAGTKTMADIYPDRPWDKRKHGMFMSHGDNWTLMHRPCHVNIRIENDGSVVIHGQHSDQGCGDFVPYSCIIADEIGCKYEDVGWKGKYSNESGYQLMDPGGSTNLSANAPQLARAAKKAKDMLLHLATLKSYRGAPVKHTREVYPTQPALFEGLSWDELDTKDSLVFEKANPSNSKTFGEVAYHHAQGSWRNTSREAVCVDDYGGSIDWRRAHNFQTHFIEVAVDEETGKVEIITAAIINDVGKVMNPEGAWGQQYGGAHCMGFGGSNFERLYYDPATAIVLNDDHEGYRIPLFNDVGYINCGLNESQQGWSAYGLSGIGENIGATTRSMTAHAARNATGVEIGFHPTTPDMVLKKLGKG